jgi:hypothetical protein
MPKSPSKTPPKTPKVHTGHCLCGAVTFRAEGTPLWIAHCHCASCRRNTGSAVATFVGFRESQFAVTAGKPKVYESSPGVKRSFCGRCGTPLTYGGARASGETHAYLGVMDHPEAYTPTFHVFTEEALPWLHIDDNAQHFRRSSRDG